MSFTLEKFTTVHLAAKRVAAKNAAAKKVPFKVKAALAAKKAKK